MVTKRETVTRNVFALKDYGHVNCAIAFFFRSKASSSVQVFPRVFPSSEKRKTGYRDNLCNPLILLAEWTGLEPATPGVTDR